VDIVNVRQGGDIVAKNAEVVIISSSGDNDLDRVRLLFTKFLDRGELDRDIYHKELIYKRNNIKNHNRQVFSETVPVTELPAGKYRFKVELYTHGSGLPLRSLETDVRIDNIRAKVHSLAFSQYDPGGPRLYGVIEDADTYRFEVFMNCSRNTTRNLILVDSARITLEQTNWMDIPLKSLSAGNYTVYLIVDELDSGWFTTSQHTHYFTIREQPQPVEEPVEEYEPPEYPYIKFPANPQPAVPIGLYGQGGFRGI
jgi:hypothetical protein